MTNRTCTVEGCVKATRSKDLCYAHYMKLWRYGTPTPMHPARWEDLAGRRIGSLIVVERIGGHGSFWSCRCDCGGQAKVRAGDLNRGTTSTCGAPVHLRHDDAEYGAAHGRCRSELGSASLHLCVTCGSPAQHWSYNHNDPDERYSTIERIAGIAYSLKPEHYSPRCVPCHKRFDLDRIDAAHLAHTA